MNKKDAFAREKYLKSGMGKKYIIFSHCALWHSGVANF
jgi:hypothetical protein